MKQILIAALLILLMSGIASAEQVEEWPFGKANVMPDHVEGVMYDFEEGSNCGDFNNTFPEIATFLTVLGGTVPDGYGPNYPSYNVVGGVMCGNTRGYMNIYPYCRIDNWTYVVNGRSAFSTISCCESDTCWTGNCYPTLNARIQLKEGTHYVSFLVSTGSNLYVRVYSIQGSNYNLEHYETVARTIDRVNGEPSNFTQFIIYLPNIDIARIDMRSAFNDALIDDLIIGGAPGYLVPEPDPTPTTERRDYSWAAENMDKLVGAPYLEWGMGYNFYVGEFYTAEEIKTIDLPYVNFDYKPTEVEWDTGIDCAGAIVWAFNQESDIVNWADATDQMKHDFTVHVDYEDIQPGDVGFIDYTEIDSDGNVCVGDGIIDEVFIIVEPKVDSYGDPVDCIRIVDGAGVQYSSTEWVNSLYDTGTSFVNYRSLKDTPKGGHSPYPKVRSTPI